MFITFLQSAIRFSTVFLFGTTGETLTEKSGHLNMGVPGVMCVGAFGGCAGLSLYLSSLSSPEQIIPWLAILIAVVSCAISGALCGLLFSFLTVTLKCNQNVTGLTLTTFGAGLNAFGFKKINMKYFSNTATYFYKLFPNLPKNWFTDLFGSYGILVYSAIIIAIIIAIFLKRTRIGLNLRSVGESPATADAAGINVDLYRYLATVIGCAIASLGGLFFIMDYLGGNVEYCIEEYGWLAVAIVIFSMWKPDLGILASFVFGALYIAPSFMLVTPVVKRLIQLVPYLITIIVLILTSLLNKKNSQPPEGLGQSYDREKR